MLYVWYCSCGLPITLPPNRIDDVAAIEPYRKLSRIEEKEEQNDMSKTNDDNGTRLTDVATFVLSDAADEVWVKEISFRAKESDKT